MQFKDADRLEETLRTQMGIEPSESSTVDAIARKLLEIRSFNPKCFQAALFLLVSTLLAVGDRETGTSAADLVTKLEKLVATQKEINVLLEKDQEKILSEVLDRLGLDEKEVKLPKEKVN